MPPTSMQLIADAQERGLLSKEAAEQVGAQRDQLIRQAMRKLAAELVEMITTGSLAKEAGIGSIIDRFRSAGPAAAKAAPKAEGFLAKLKHGGRTGSEAGGVGWGDVVGNLGKMMALAGLTAGATAGVQSIGRHHRDSKLNDQIQTSYSQMFNEYPKLRDIEERSPGRIQRHFGVLTQFAPSLAATPTVAGAFIQSSAQMEQIDVGAIKNLAETQSRIDEMNEKRHGIRGVTPLKAGEFAAKAMLA